jgi:hypothetical protein
VLYYVKRRQHPCRCPGWSGRTGRRGREKQMKPGTKYYPLHEYLRPLPQDEPITLTFDEIEAIIKDVLPPSARVSRAWWANSTTPQGRAWLDADWLVDAVDLEGAWVVFRRAGEDSTRVRRLVSARAGRPAGHAPADYQ